MAVADFPTGSEETLGGADIAPLTKRIHLRLSVCPQLHSARAGKHCREVLSGADGLGGTLCFKMARKEEMGATNGNNLLTTSATAGPHLLQCTHPISGQLKNKVYWYKPPATAPLSYPALLFTPKSIGHRCSNLPAQKQPKSSCIAENSTATPNTPITYRVVQPRRLKQPSCPRTREREAKTDVEERTRTSACLPLHLFPCCARPSSSPLTS